MNQGFTKTIKALATSARHMAVITLGKIRVGDSELRSRINIENARQLKQAGFSAGSKFSVTYSQGRVEVKADDEGTNTISPKRFGRRDGSEVIGERLDLRSIQIHHKFSGQERVLAIYLERRIIFMHLPAVGKGYERAEQLIEAIKRGKLNTAAFYAGIGTLDAALHDGFAKEGITSEVRFANDSWSLAVNALIADNPAATNLTRTFDGGIEHFIGTGAEVDDIHMAVLGIPCKGASKLNVGTRDAPEFHPWAGHQVMNAVLALQQMGFPPLVLVENVTAYADTASFSMLVRVLEEQGYQTQLVGDRDADGKYCGINSNHYGVIERRVRMGLLAYPQGITLDFGLMKKTGPSTKTVGDIRLPDSMVDPAEYEKGKHLNREEKREKGWRNRIVSNSDNTTPSMSADCWKQRIEDPKFEKFGDPTKCRLPLPEEHAALKGHDPKIISSLVANSHAHTALGNGTAKACWVEFARCLAENLKLAVNKFEGIKASMASVAQSMKPQEGPQMDLFAI
jgi:DNA (cytosine-5)-methyltransferase 1